MKLRLIKEDDPRLRQRSVVIKKIDYKVRQLARDLHELMVKERGIGISAVQTGYNIQLMIIGTKINKSSASATVMINPLVVSAGGEQIFEESCLSFPGLIVPVKRPRKVLVKYLNLQGKPQEVLLEGLAAVVFAHEFDHGIGVVLKDYIDTGSNSLEELIKLKPELLETLG